MEDQQVPPAPVEQQVTSKTPATKQKNPKRVAAGKAIAERTRIARETQKKTLIEAQSIIARADPPAPPPVSVEPPPETTKNILTTTQWVSIGSFIVSLIGLYYKRKEIKNFFSKKPAPSSPVLPRAPPPSPVLPRASPIRQMD